MMGRAEIKYHAWQTVKQNYKAVIGVYLVAVAILAVLAYVPFGNILIGLIIQVGLAGYLLNRFRRQQPGIGMLFRPFSRYGRVLGGSLWRILWTILWSLLFVVPGIVKSYSYFCTGFILADSPTVEATQALELSKRMMDGNKGKVFVMHLTFLGWWVLAYAILFVPIIAVAVGIAGEIQNEVSYGAYGAYGTYGTYGANPFFGYLDTLSAYSAYSGLYILVTLPYYCYYVLFLGPYFDTTNAGFYEEIKRDAIARGVVYEYEFGLSEAEWHALGVYAKQNYYGQAPYGQANPYGQPPYGAQGPYGQNPYGQGPYGQNPYGQGPYGQNPYMQPLPPPYGQPAPNDQQREGQLPPDGQPLPPPYGQPAPNDQQQEGQLPPDGQPLPSPYGQQQEGQLPPDGQPDPCQAPNPDGQPLPDSQRPSDDGLPTFNEPETDEE
ncbi:MAG: DUF975 family protein [Clostridiales bacterium]|nr:DUF975 family protein [Clostridiales bacterium]